MRDCHVNGHMSMRRILQKMRAGFLVISLFLFAWVCGPAAADDFEPHERILSTAVAHMESEAQRHHHSRFDVAVEPGRLDSRLRLRLCEEGLEGFLNSGASLSGSSTVGVRCNGPVQWTLYVPVRIAVEGEVVVLADPQPRGTVLAPAQLRLERQEISGLSGGYLTGIEEARNMVLRRALNGGTVLTPHLLEPARLVQRGQEVLLVADNGSVAVRVRGEALADGARGDRVRVRNLSSRSIVEGVVLSEGVVGVTM